MERFFRDFFKKIALLHVLIGSATQVFAAPASTIALRSFCQDAGCAYFEDKPKERLFISASGKDKKIAILSLKSPIGVVDDLAVEDDQDFLIHDQNKFRITQELAALLIDKLGLKKIEFETTPVVEKKLSVIVIDPGHGGNDIGTSFKVSSRKLEEKDISLIYALQLKQEIEKKFPEIKVVLTRNDDHFVSLEDRAKLANTSNADLFLSLHVNHAPDARIFGAETYILNPNATDDEARKTALLENDADLKLIKEKTRKNPVLNILAEMEQTKYIQKSAVVAAYIQQELSQLNETAGLKNRGVKQALFYVLSQAAMPSVLVEMGFLSNSGDRKRLMDLKFQEEFVKRIIQALERYQEKR